MQPDSRKEEQPAEPRKDVKERNRRFQIVKLEERIAPGGGGGPDSVFTVHPHQCNTKKYCLG
jgi:hypothetical protein